MAANVIISYDGTPNDDDALALGKMLARAGFRLALAYVRHSREFDPRREEVAQHDAEQRLERGAATLGDAEVTRHVVIGASTGAGLGQLAESEGASMVVFGSDYRTTPGHVEPGTSAQHLLDGGLVAVAIAAAGLRAQLNSSIRSIAVPLAGPTNHVARETAGALAAKLGGNALESRAEPVDLIVVGSQPGAPAGHVVIGGDVRNELSSARSSVLVLAAGVPSSSPSTEPSGSPGRGVGKAVAAEVPYLDQRVALPRQGTERRRWLCAYRQAGPIRGGRRTSWALSAVVRPAAEAQSDVALVGDRCAPGEPWCAREPVTSRTCSSRAFTSSARHRHWAACHRNG